MRTACFALASRLAAEVLPFTRPPRTRVPAGTQNLLFSTTLPHLYVRITHITLPPMVRVRKLRVLKVTQDTRTRAL